MAGRAREGHKVHKGRNVVEGLTTSASILSVAAIGIAVALNVFVLAVGVTLLILFSNWDS
jgi:uncharacterized membrane protein YhiD involved in acid resistance